MSAAPPFDGFEEREQPALGRSLALALAVHLVLFAILFVGIRWESHPPAAMVVELPSVSKASNAPAAPLAVVIKEDRSVIVRIPGAKGGRGEERRVARGELAQLVRARQAEHPDTPVLIAADKNVRYEAVLNVMDDLQREQIRRVGLLVKPAQ